MTSLPPRTLVETAPPTQTAARRTWQIGALTYTLGGLALLFVWLLGGDLALNVRDRSIPPVMQVMFRRFGASDMMTGLIFSSLPGILNMILGPIVAYRSDRLRSRWGRRIPFMIIPVPFIMLSTVGLAFAPQLGEMLDHALGAWSPGTANASLIVMAISWTVFEVGSITTYAVFGAFMTDVVPQSVMGVFFGLYRAIGLLVGMAFYYNVLGQAQAHYSWIFLSVGAIYGVAFTLMCLKVREGPPPEHIGLPAERPGLFSAITTYFREGFGNPYYIWVFVATILGSLCSGVFNLYTLFYSASLGMSDATVGHYITFSYFVSFVLSIPLGLAADRYHPLRLSMALLALYGVVMAGAGFLVHSPGGFGIALFAHTVISGSMTTAWASMTQRLLPRGNFAVISSAGGLLGSIVGIFFAPCIGYFLDAMHHEYRYTFFINAELTLGAFLAYFAVYRRFMAMGGPKNYVPPE
jgi:MFS family permease